jgi:hypothetical protein
MSLGSDFSQGFTVIGRDQSKVHQVDVVDDDLSLVHFTGVVTEVGWFTTSTLILYMPSCRILTISQF